MASSQTAVDANNDSQDAMMDCKAILASARKCNKKKIMNTLKNIFINRIDTTLGIFLALNLATLISLNSLGDPSERPQETAVLAMATLSQAIASSLTVASFFQGLTIKLLALLKINAQKFEIVLILLNFGNGLFILGAFCYAIMIVQENGDDYGTYKDQAQSLVYVATACAAGQAFFSARTAYNFKDKLCESSKGSKEDQKDAAKELAKSALGGAMPISV